MRDRRRSRRTFDLQQGYGLFKTAAFPGGRRGRQKEASLTLGF
jgi:hypothetical protein